MADNQEKTFVSFTHYETGVVRTVAQPDKLQQFSRDFIAAFITSTEHYEDLPWYREMVKVELEKAKAANPKSTEGDIQIKAFPQVRIQFVKKFFPEFAPKERKHRTPKPAKLDMWEL